MLKKINAIIIFLFLFSQFVFSTPYKNALGDTSYLNLLKQAKTIQTNTEFLVNGEILSKFVIFSVIFLVIAYIAIIFSGENKIILKSIFNRKIFFELFETQSPAVNSLLFLYKIISILLLGYLFILIKNNFFSQIAINNVIVFFIPLLFYLFESVFLKLFNIVFELKELNKIFSQTESITGLIIIPSLILIFFIINFFPDKAALLIIISIIILLLFYTIRTYNIFSFFSAKGFSKLLLLLYLCTIEILPIVIFVKIIIDKS